MNRDTDPIDTSDDPHCPNTGCPYIVFLGNDDDVDYYCMECSEGFSEDEVIYND